VALRLVEESALSVYENDRLVDWIDQGSAHVVRDFVRGIFPPRIAPFFIFDGERIQEFAESSHHERDLVEAIQDIMHINVYRQLREDLGKYVADYVEVNEVRKPDSGDYFKLQEDAERIDADLEMKKTRKKEVDREIEEVEAGSRRAAEELRRIASPHATQRDELLVDQERIERELDASKEEVEKGFELLPVSLSGPLFEELRIALEKEQHGLRNFEALSEIRRKLSLVSRRVFYDPTPPPPAAIALSAEQVVYYEGVFGRAAEEVFELADFAGDAKRLHDIGDAERERILGRLSEVSRNLSRLKDAIDLRERLAGELRDVQLKLQATSDDPAVSGLITRKKSLDEKRGQLDGERTTLSSEIQRLDADLAARRRQIADRQRERAATTEAKRVVRLAREAQGVLDDFIKKLAPEKIQALEKHFRFMYDRLRKPEDPVASIVVDPTTWDVVLKDKGGRPLERRVFSAGMKEMYALSLLWALARASGRELPIVVDTPLGRLDSKNRSALCHYYFPQAGHQVIVLSTDKEVDQEWFAVLRPHVARQYRLDYEPGTESTVIRPGYFF
jgi:DNA sulfur modification protein DndD